MNGIYETWEDIPEATFEYVDSWFDNEESTKEETNNENA